MVATYTTEKLADRAALRKATGTALIDVSEQVYTGYIEFLALVVPAGQAHEDVAIYLDLNKATTGFGAVNTTETIQFALAMAPDGTNLRTLTDNTDLETTAITGTNAAANLGRAQLLRVPLLPAGTYKVYVKLSAETGGDCQIPFTVVSRGYSHLTVTPLYEP